MSNNKVEIPKKILNQKLLPFLILFFIFIFTDFINSYAQPENPPAPMIVTKIRDMSFGAFAQGIAGGSVTIDPYGVRSSSGDIILLNLGYLYYPAIFEVDINPGTVINLTLGSKISLVDEITGHSMELELNSIYPNTPYVVPTEETQFFIGGILSVGNNLDNPSGTYIGTFSVIFYQE
ncbi:MAG TPA: DUF4402 domain-containing protein [Bacteroidales bacterium]|nr:DUF4402 domain-containing protein [Bacteroidales bacterium]HPS16755.1 DUF4402 domain-containing protein [Bacteroidales bacterium]